MLSQLIRRRWPLPAIAVAVVAVFAGMTVITSADDAGELVVYNGRSHYGDEDVFSRFEKDTGIDVVLRGGTGPELFERLRREGRATPADVLITTDLANLWRAEDAGLLSRVSTPALRDHIPAELHDPDEQWWALTTRLRVPVVSTTRVAPGEVTSYEDLGNPRYKGRLCLRTSNNEYNQSLVADMLAKRGPTATAALLRSWMSNDPRIINSDGELLAVMADGKCDVGLSNHYYLARARMENDAFPVAPAWPDQDGAGAHANLSGAGVVKWSDNRAAAIKLIEYLTSARAQKGFTGGGEFAANPAVPPDPQIGDWANVKRDPIDANRAGPLLSDAIALMLEVGWR